jgi:plasmid stabilization system protein ParE
MFVEEIHAAFSLLEQFPLAGEAVHGRIEDLRRVLLSGVQYHVYYVADIAAATIEVLALWHTSRGTKPRI